MVVCQPCPPNIPPTGKQFVLTSIPTIQTVSWNQIVNTPRLMYSDCPERVHSTDQNVLWRHTGIGLGLIVHRVFIWHVNHTESNGNPNPSDHIALTFSSIGGAQVFDVKMCCTTQPSVPQATPMAGCLLTGTLPDQNLTPIYTENGNWKPILAWPWPDNGGFLGAQVELSIDASDYVLYVVHGVGMPSTWVGGQYTHPVTNPVLGQGAKTIGRGSWPWSEAQGQDITIQPTNVIAVPLYYLPTVFTQQNSEDLD